MRFAEKAKELYLSGYCCSEAVMHAARESGRCAPPYGGLCDVPDEMLRASTGFLAGIGHNRSLCGALASAVMLVSLKYGRLNLMQDKQAANDTCSLLFRKVTARYGSPLCADIAGKEKTGCDFIDPKRREYCADVVKFIAEITEEIIVS